MAKVPRRTETSEAPCEQGVTNENTACIRPRSNAVRDDASLVECSRTVTTGW